jgi:hypothetical protein
MEAKKYNVPRDVFVHLLAIITLYISALSFGNVLFTLINRYLPDPLETGMYYPHGGVRWAIAAEVVMFPVYFFLTRFLNNEYQSREGSEPRIRKWLIYFTLFAAALAIIIDLVTLISRYLGGEITARFVLKVAVVLFIAAVIFRYYLWELNLKKTKYIRILVGVVLGAVLAAVVAGFLFVGSPRAERLRRFDEKRVSDLQSIQNEVVNYWLEKDKLPDDLIVLQVNRGVSFSSDPVTGSAYEYKALEVLKFELCANFEAPSNESSPNRVAMPHMPPRPVVKGLLEADFYNWSHEAGRQCFTRIINPETYDQTDDEPKR